MESLLDKLHALSESDFYPYHMPGHKRYGNPSFAIDITEIDGFDNLHHATEIIKEAQERAARVFGAIESFFLVNGSTCGLLSAMCASFQRGDRVLVARNCHKAVYHALEIRGIEPIYIYPETDVKYDINAGITVRRVEEVLKNLESDGCGNLKGMILTSPTYEGLVSEIKEIAELLHSRDMILIVDEAHGAHFGFHKAFPKSAVTQGADLVIQSLHKTLPSMTQTALLHRCTDRVDLTAVQKYLGVFQTSSPSYVFMAYMDECIRLLEANSAELFEVFGGRLENFYKSCESFKHICVRMPQQGIDDPGKIVISAGEHFGGKDLYEALRCRYHLQPEMYSGSYVLAIMTVCDTDEGFERLYEALAELDRELEAGADRNINQMSEGDVAQMVNSSKLRISDIKKTLASLIKNKPHMKFKPCDVEGLKSEKIKLTDAAGRVSMEYIYLYPPGVPFIVPGEIISEETVNALEYLQNCGYELQGPADVKGETIRVAE